MMLSTPMAAGQPRARAQVSTLAQATASTSGRIVSKPITFRKYHGLGNDFILVRRACAAAIVAPPPHTHSSHFSLLVAAVAAPPPHTHTSLFPCVCLLGGQPEQPGTHALSTGGRQAV